MRKLLVFTLLLSLAPNTFAQDPKTNIKRALQDALERRVACERKAKEFSQTIVSLENLLKPYEKTVQEIFTSLAGLSPKHAQEVIRGLRSTRAPDIFYILKDSASRDLLKDLSAAYAGKDMVEAACNEIKVTIQNLQPFVTPENFPAPVGHHGI